MLDRISLRDLLAVIFRYQVFVLGTVVVGTLLTFVVTLFAPRVYHSEARFLMKWGRELTVPMASASGSSNLWLTQRPELLKSAVEVFREKTVPIEIVTSWRRDEEAARAEGRQPIELTYYPRISEVTGFAKLRYAVLRVLSEVKRLPETLGIRKKLTEDERLIGALDASLQIEPVPGTDVLKVGIAWGAPGLPTLLLERVIEAFRERHLAAHTLPGTARFFDAQVTQLEQQMAALRTEITRYEQESGIVDIAQQRKTNIETLSMLGQKRMATQLDRVDARSPRDARTAEGKIARLDEEIRRLTDETLALDAKAKNLDDLVLRLEILTDNYKLYKKDQEGARIAEAQNQAQLVSFSVIQKPTAATDPVKPRMWLNLAVGFGVSLLVALLTVFYWDYLKHGLDDAVDVRRQLGLRVLATRAHEVGLE